VENGASMRDGEYLQIYGDMRKANLLEVLGIIDEHRGKFNRVMHLYCAQLDGKSIEDFSSEDRILIDRFYHYRGLYGIVCALRRDIKSMHYNLYGVYSGSRMSRIDMAKRISTRWVKITDECENTINCMMVEYEYLNSYFKKHLTGDTIERIFNNYLVGLVR